MKRIAITAIALCSAAFFAQSALAASTVTVRNDWSNDVKVAVYSGKDANCDWEAENEKVTVPANTDQSFTCKGYGRDRCKVTIKSTSAKPETLCKSLYNTCANAAMLIEDSNAVVLTASADAAEPQCKYAPAPTNPTPK
ncbi:MAG: hypothetical protein GC201_05780 [Alphaproteobacteria bacterium]|nr:hypothetical protein [Alphaproteobacteria bacterium]